jgi:hypothetical protein
MDRDPKENVVDPEDRTTPTTGQSPYGESGAERSRAGEQRHRPDDRPAGDEGREIGDDDPAQGRKTAAPTTMPPPD